MTLEATSMWLCRRGGGKVWQYSQTFSPFPLHLCMRFSPRPPLSKPPLACIGMVTTLKNEIFLQCSVIVMVKKVHARGLLGASLACTGVEQRVCVLSTKTNHLIWNVAFRLAVWLPREYSHKASKPSDLQLGSFLGGVLPWKINFVSC